MSAIAGPEQSSPAAFGCLDEYVDSLCAALDAQSAEAHPDGRCGPVERAAGADLSEAGFRERFADRGLPVVIEGGLPAWDRECWSRETLLRVAGDELWTVRRGASYGAMETAQMPLREFVAGLDLGQGRVAQAQAPGGWYAANNAVPEALAAAVVPPAYFPGYVFRREDTRVWIGGEGAGVHPHRDLQDNFLLQVEGAKEVALAPPHVAGELGAARVSPCLESVEGGVDPWADARFTVVRLEPGDLLYMPAAWLHATRSRGAFALSVNFFAASCFKAIGVMIPPLAGLAGESWES